MGDVAVRSVFAEFGLDFDEKSLAKANALVDKAIANVGRLIGATNSADKAEALFAARQRARAALRHQQSGQAAADAAKAAGAPRDVSFLGKLREVAAADAKAKDDARKAELDRAHTLAARAVLGHAPPTSDPFGKRSEKGATSFGGKFGAEQWKAAAKPVEGLIGVLTKLEKKASTAIGQKLPRAFQRLAERVGVARGDFASMGQIFVGATGAVTGAIVGAATAAMNFTAEFTAASEALRETARSARVTSSQLQELQYAGAASGVGADRVTASITALGQRLRDMNNRVAGSGGTASLLRRLGISARDSSGQVRDTVDIALDLGRALEHVSSPRRRIRIAQSLGIDQRMLDILHSGAGGLEEFMAKAREFGDGVTPEATESARQFAIAQAGATRAMVSMRSVIFTSLAPSLGDLVTRGARLLGSLSKITRGSHLVRNAIVALSAVAVAAALPIIAAWLPVVAPFAAAAIAGLALAVALDDVQNFLEGNNSLTGEYIEKLKQMADGYIGLGNSSRVIRFLRDDWEALGQNIARVLDFIDRLPAAIQPALAPLRLLLRAFTFATGREEGVSGGGAGAPPAPPGNAAPPTPGRPRAPAPAPVQLGFDGQPIAAQAPPTGDRPRDVPVPATRAVPAPGVARGTVTSTTRVEGDRNQYHFHGLTTPELMQQIQRLNEEASRRRNARMSPREGDE